LFVAVFEIAFHEEVPMDKAMFWKLIDASRKDADGDADDQIEALAHRLESLAPEDIVEFDRIFSVYHDRAYDRGLWGAAYIIGGGCSDDGFMDFRGWLISRGEKVYEAALADPESLAKVVDADDDCQVEGFQYVASQAWEEKTGRPLAEFPKHAYERKSEPSGADWEEDDLDERFPKLCKKFS
jgi:hypothetical protein